MIRLTALGCWFRFTSLVIYAEHMMRSAITIANKVIHTGSSGGSGYFDGSSITMSFFFSFPGWCFPSLCFSPMTETSRSFSVDTPLGLLGGSTHPGLWLQQLYGLNLRLSTSTSGHGHWDVRCDSDSHVKHLEGHLYVMVLILFMFPMPVQKWWESFCGLMRKGAAPSLNLNLILV